MSDLLPLAGDFAWGALLGGIFYGGLWWTVRRVAAKGQGLWLFGGFFLRSGMALGGFYAIAGSDWHGLAACFLGFLGARAIVSRLVRPHVVRGAAP
jgi:F1F0 ATPase subunit 2